MGKEAELDKLFKDWKADYDNRKLVFVKDGINNEKEFESSKQKILFILRDANFVQEPADIRVIGENPKANGNTWNNVIRWTKGILEGSSAEKECNKDYAKNDKNEFKRVWDSIAVMNLKKEAGGGRTDMKKLREAVLMDRENIVKEIVTINPDIIITCEGEILYRTISNIKRISDEDMGIHVPNQQHQSFYWYNIRIDKLKHDIKVLSTYHPCVKSKGDYTSIKIFNAVMELYKESMPSKE